MLPYAIISLMAKRQYLKLPEPTEERSNESSFNDDATDLDINYVQTLARNSSSFTNNDDLFRPKKNGKPTFKQLSKIQSKEEFRNPSRIDLLAPKKLERRPSMKLNNLTMSIVEDSADTFSQNLGESSFGSKMHTQRHPSQERRTILTKVTNATSETEARRQSVQSKASLNTVRISNKRKSQGFTDRSLRSILGGIYRADSVDLNSQRSQEKLKQYEMMSEVKLPQLAQKRNSSYQPLEHFMRNLQRENRVSDVLIPSEEKLSKNLTERANDQQQLYKGAFTVNPDADQPYLNSTHDMAVNINSVRGPETKTFQVMVSEHTVPLKVDNSKAGFNNLAIRSHIGQIPVTQRKRRQKQRQPENFVEKNKDQVLPKQRRLYCNESAELKKDAIENIWRERFVSEILNVKGNDPDRVALRKQQVEKLKKIEQFRAPDLNQPNQGQSQSQQDFAQLRRTLQEDFFNQIGSLQDRFKVLEDPALQNEFALHTKKVVDAVNAKMEPIKEDVFGEENIAPEEWLIPQTEAQQLAGQKQALREMLNNSDFLTQIEKRNRRAYWERIKKNTQKNITLIQATEKAQRQNLLQMNAEQQSLAATASKVKSVARSMSPTLQQRQSSQVTSQTNSVKISLLNTPYEHSQSQSLDQSKFSAKIALKVKQPRTESIEQKIARVHQQCQAKIQTGRMRNLLDKLFIFRRQLLDELNELQAEQLRYEEMQSFEFPIEGMSVDEIKGKMQHRFDLKLKEILEATEIFHQYREKLDQNLALEQLRGVAKGLVQNLKQTISNKVQVQAEQLLPILKETASRFVNSYNQTLANTTRVNSVTNSSFQVTLAGQEDKSKSTFNTLQKAFLGALQKRLEAVNQESLGQRLFMKAVKDAPNPFESGSSRSESSEFLETDKASSDYRNSRFNTGENPIQIQQFDYIEPIGENTSRNKKKPLIPSQSQRVEELGLSVRSQAIKASGIFPLAKHFQKMHRVEDTSRIQNSRLSRFSETIAKNLFTSAAAAELAVQQKAMKDMLKKQLHGKDFAYKNLDRVMFKHIESSEEERDYEHLDKPQDYKDAVNKRLKELVKAHHAKQPVPRRIQKNDSKDSQKSKESNSPSIDQPQTQRNLATTRNEQVYQLREMTERIATDQTLMLPLKQPNQEYRSPSRARMRNRTTLNVEKRTKFSPSFSQDSKKSSEKTVAAQAQDNTMLPIKTTKKINKELAKSIFVDEVIKSRTLPLPLVNKVQNKTLVLNSYPIGPENFEAFVDSFAGLVPYSLDKIVLVNNNLSEHAIAMLFQKLASVDRGLLELIVQKNYFGESAFSQIIKFLQSPQVEMMKTLAFKDPLSKKKLDFSKVLHTLATVAKRFKCLVRLALQQFRVGREDANLFAQVLKKMPCLRNLSLSGNKMVGEDFIAFFSQLNPQSYNLTHLDISWNSPQCQTSEAQKTLDKKFSEFLHRSTSIQHLDVSGMPFLDESLKTIATRGIRKSKTLLVVHMSACFQTDGLLEKMCQWLRVVGVEKEAPKTKVNYSSKPHTLCKAKFPANRQTEMLIHEARRQKERNKEAVSQAFESKVYRAEIYDRVVFQRFLGHLEILNSFRWHQTTDDGCYICNKWAYSIFVWDTKLAQEPYLFNTINKKILGNIKQKFAPVLCSVDSIKQVLPMIPIQHFLSRLQANIGTNFNRRIKDTEETDRIKAFVQKVVKYEKKQIQSRAQEKMGQSQQDAKVRWDRLLLKYRAKTASKHEPQGLIQLHTAEDLYKASTKGNSLYVCAAYLPPGFTTAIIQGQQTDNAQFLSFDVRAVPFTKQPRKLTKKISEVRTWSKDKSVFAQYRLDNPDFRRKQLEYDRKQSKVFRLSKDPEEIDKIYDVLLRHFLLIRDNFFYCNSNPRLYPLINREEFLKLCNIWQIKDDNLKLADIDRQFIATNVELESQEANDDLALCRFEFSEIIVRMAKTKFFDTKIAPTLWQAVEMVIEGDIAPNNPVRFTEDWRELYIYNLQVDDLLAMNLESLKKCYDLVRGKKIYPTITQTCDFFATIPDFPGRQDQIGLSYAFAKMQFVEEQDVVQRKQYDQMKFVEWLEFLPRLAWLIWEDPHEAMEKKLYRLMDLMFNMFKVNVRSAEEDDGVDSESDYDDTIALDLISSHYPKEVYAGYGLVKRTDQADDDH